MPRLLWRKKRKERRMADYDVLIVGGGPGGLAAGQYSARAGRKTAIVEEMSCGGQTMIIDEIENYPGLGQISGFELAQKFEEQAEKFGCEVIYDQVQSIEQTSDAEFKLNLFSSSVTAKALIIATGAKHKVLGVPGEEQLTGHGVSYCATCDGPFFKGKKILVCGGGDSAIQEAVYLSKLSDDVTVCHRRDAFRAQAGVVNKLKATKAKYKMNQNVISINGTEGKVTSVTFLNKDTNEEYTEDFDGVFVFVGMEPKSEIVPMCEKDSAGYIVTDATMKTSVKGIFAVGDVRNTPFRQIVTAASDGAIAAHYASEYIDSLK